MQSYTLLFFADSDIDRRMKRFVRDHLHFKNDLWCIAHRVIRAVRRDAAAASASLAALVALGRAEAFGLALSFAAVLGAVHPVAVGIVVGSSVAVLIHPVVGRLQLLRTSLCAPKLCDMRIASRSISSSESGLFGTGSSVAGVAKFSMSFIGSFLDRVFLVS